MFSFRSQRVAGCSPLYHCCQRHYAEHSGYFQKTAFLKEAPKELQESKAKEVTFYDSNTGKPLFYAPRNRSWDEFVRESKAHGWPSFRDDEVNWDYVRCLKNGESVSVDGTHLGHNLPDRRGNRYCINLVSVAGLPSEVLADRAGLITSTATKDSVDAKVGVGLIAVKGCNIVNSISPTSIFQGTDLRIGHRLVSVNKTSCRGMNKTDAIKLFEEAEGTVQIMSEEVGLLSVKVTKKSKNDKVGIGLKEEGGNVVISSIYDTGLFAKTDLTEECHLLAVNDQSVAGMSRGEAIALFQDADGDITVLAEDPRERSF